MKDDKPHSNRLLVRLSCDRQFLPKHFWAGRVSLLAGFAFLLAYCNAGSLQLQAQSKADATMAFDEDVGFDNTWAAEKKLTALFKAEGFLGMWQAYTNGVENRLFKAGVLSTNGANITVQWSPIDKGVVHYAYVRAMYPHPATYRLSAARGSAGCAVLMSVAGKISADRLSAIKEALQEFDSTKAPVIKVKGDFTKRGDFRVKVNQDDVEVENLWRGKGI